ncbi:uncharacterized protein N7459_007857 [Penicillium hispanicum]|uniref:uncharacterized protein n=1 Tax=Penicillium hispanicum TaxID=1080232 RepID=UPI002540903E|nr:uncharacterized protein N7459_007857 [Penicillium hispanicum]KAJ5573430.1 hypothetical protein N7459_007857 [Penicillium hispanicum]
MAGKAKRTGDPQFMLQHEQARRALTPPLPEPAKRTRSSRKTFDQLQSSIFELPRELRDMIYQAILVSPSTIHLEYVEDTDKFRSFDCQIPVDRQQKNTFIDHQRCFSQAGVLRDSSCIFWPTLEQNGGQMSLVLPELHQPSALAFLCTCRRVYFEAIDVLYAKNQFYVEGWRTLFELPRCCPQSRLNTFRSLQFEFASTNVLSNEISSDRRGTIIQALAVVNNHLRGVLTLRIVYNGPGEYKYEMTWERKDLEGPLVRKEPPINRLRVLPVND